MNRLNEIAQALERMGTTAEEVAATLRANGIQGVRNTVRVLNPIVRYLQDTLRIDSLDADLMTGNYVRINGTGVPQVPLPQPVLDFLDAFSRGAYPDLELPTS